jgi:hypothetical protein
MKKCIHSIRPNHPTDPAMVLCTKCNSWKENIHFSKHDRGKGGLCSWCKECQNAHRREWYKQNREKVLLYAKKYSTINFDKIKKREKKYRIENAALLSSRYKDYYDLNIDKMKAKARKYYESHREERLMKNKMWRDENQEKKKEYMKIWRLNNLVKIKEYEEKHRRENNEKGRLRDKKNRANLDNKYIRHILTHVHGIRMPDIFLTEIKRQQLALFRHLKNNKTEG